MVQCRVPSAARPTRGAKRTSCSPPEAPARRVTSPSSRRRHPASWGVERESWGSVDVRRRRRCRATRAHPLLRLPGSGKTTVARIQTREAGAIRFSTDEWMADFGVDYFDELRDRVQARLGALGKELLARRAERAPRRRDLEARGTGCAPRGRDKARRQHRAALLRHPDRRTVAEARPSVTPPRPTEQHRSRGMCSTTKPGSNGPTTPSCSPRSLRRAPRVNRHRDAPAGAVSTVGENGRCC